jgi:hypothetical protein
LMKSCSQKKQNGSRYDTETDHQPLQLLRRPAPACRMMHTASLQLLALAQPALLISSCCNCKFMPVLSATTRSLYLVFSAVVDSCCVSCAA